MWNSKDFLGCNLKLRWCFSDFVEYLDPTYGACFTYGQKLGNNTNERSGPAYGEY